MRVLVSAASKHGATAGIAERIGEVLRDRDIEVTVIEPGKADTIGTYDAVVLGSAVYLGQWLPDAIGLADRIGGLRPSPKVWVFSSGPVGIPPKPEEDPVDITQVLDAVSPLEHRVFAGKIDKSRLSFSERAMMIAVRASEGDFRDWTSIDSWASSIADTLRDTKDRP